MTTGIGVDVGGTFTDFVALRDDGTAVVEKQLTTPDDPSIAIFEGLAKLEQAAGASLSEADRVVHGTTLVANSLIERRGAKTALVTTQGFRDVIEIGRESRYDVYDLELVRPEPLVPRPLRFEVAERIRSDGTVREPLDVDGARKLAGVLREAQVESVAISLLNAYVNPEHEELLAQILQAEMPELDVSWSAAISPEWREYERSSSVAANAFVRPLVKTYLRKLETGLSDRGGRNQLYVMLSNGGVTSADVAAEFAVQLVESGPAGGVMAAAFFAAQLDVGSLISFDMGGTTTKVSLIENGAPLQSPELEVARVARFRKGSGLPLRVPSVELAEIGAGGGSLGHVDSLGLLKVGPRSAGATPGPAAYGRGGENPTVTDADLRLGYLNPAYFLGGEMPLYPQLAEEALASVGKQIGLDADDCARGIFEIVNQQMALALRTHIVERGRDPRRFALLAFGGAGPVHAYEVARHLGISSIISPPIAGVVSALGFLVSPFRIDLSSTHPALISALDWALVDERFAGMERRAADLLQRAGRSKAEVTWTRVAEMRYQGQGYMVGVPLPGQTDAPVTAVFREAFERAYQDRFGPHLTSAEIEIVHWRLAATAGGVSPLRFVPPTSSGDPIKGERDAYFPEVHRHVTCPVYERYRLCPGDLVPGPALIEERESTTVIGPAGEGRLDGLGNLVVTVAR